MIKVYYSAVDGFRKTRSFKTLAGAHKFAVHCVGEHPDFGSHYAVSDDGVGKIEVDGCTLAELFAGPQKPEMVPLHNEDWQAPVEYALKSECEERVVDCDSDDYGRVHNHYGWFRKADLEAWAIKREAEREACRAHYDTLPF